MSCLFILLWVLLMGMNAGELRAQHKGLSDSHLQPLTRIRDYPPMLQNPVSYAALEAGRGGQVYIGVGSFLTLTSGLIEARAQLPSELTALAVDTLHDVAFVACQSGFGIVERNPERPDFDRLRYRALKTFSGSQPEYITRIAISGSDVYFYSQEKTYIFGVDAGGTVGTLTFQEKQPKEAPSLGLLEYKNSLYVLRPNRQWQCLTSTGLKLPALPTDWAAAESLQLQSPPDANGNLLVSTSKNRLWWVQSQGKLKRVCSLKDLGFGDDEEITGVVPFQKKWLVSTRYSGSILLSDLNQPTKNAQIYRPVNREPIVHSIMIDGDGRLWMTHDATYSYAYILLPLTDRGDYAQQPRGRINDMAIVGDRVYLATDGGLLSNVSAEHRPAQLQNENQAFRRRAQFRSDFPSYDALVQEIQGLVAESTDLQTRLAEQKGNKRIAQRIARKDAELSRKRAELARMERDLNSAWKSLKSRLPHALNTESPRFDYVVGMEQVGCRDLLEVPAGVLVATDAGISYIAGNRARPINDPRLKNCAYLTQHADSPDFAYAVCENTHIQTIRRTGNQWAHIAEIEWNYPHRINSIHAEKADRLWLGTADGVYELHLLSPTDALPKVRPVRLPGIAEDVRADLRVFFGQLHAISEEKVFRYENGSFKDVTKDYKAIRSENSAVLELLNSPLSTDARNLWWVRERQLKHLSSVSGNSGEAKAQTFDVLELIRSVRCMRTDAGGQLWIAAENQVLSLDPDKMPTRSITKKTFRAFIRSVRILDVGAMGDTSLRDSVLDSRHTFSLPYAGYYRVLFEYGANSYDAPERLILQLQTPDGNWTNLVSLQEVIELEWAYGEQEVRVRAVDAFGNNSETAVFRFQIAPPIWWRWYALVLYAVLLALLGWWVVGLISHRAEARLAARNKELERLVDEKTASLALRQKDLENLNDQLNSKNAELEMQKTVIEQTNNELEERNEELIDNRSLLVQSEKMAALGEITPAIAHEINSPLGAISNTIHNMGQTLPQLLSELPQKMTQLKPENAQLVFRLTESLIQQPQQLSAREERRVARQLRETLSDTGLKNAEDWADRLVKAGLHEHIADLMPLLLSSDAKTGLEMLEQVGGAGRQLMIMNRSIDRAIHIVKALKNYVYRRADTSEPVAFDLAENIDVVLTLYEYHIKKGITLEQDYADLPHLLGFPEELSQVWTNLLMNAVYALNLRIREQSNREANGNHDTKDKMPAFVATLRIQLALDTAIDTAIVRVTDNGPGIPDEIQKRIFEALYTTKPKGEGTGLGLSICSKIINKHGGSISVTSEPGRTQFVVRLPVGGPDAVNNLKSYEDASKLT